MNTDQSPSVAESEPVATSYRAQAFADAKPELAAPGATPERLAYLQEHGFVIITDFVDNPMIPTLREAGRRVTEACAPEHGYSKIDCSKAYVHRAKDDEPWAIRGLIHPAFNEPSFAEFHGSADFLHFVHSWCGLEPEDMECCCGAIRGGTRVDQVGTETRRGGAPEKAILHRMTTEGKALRIIPRRSKNSAGKKSAQITSRLLLSGTASACSWH
jgi:hypothetical protein